MKKLLNKSMGLALAFLLIFSLLIVEISKIDFLSVKVKAEYSRNYEELSDKELDEMSYRSTPGNENPQITVFTHGLGCDPSYWSHRVTTNEDGKDKWVFGYSSGSMIERLRQKIGEDRTTVMTASVGFGDEAREWANTKKTVKEAQSKLVCDENEYIDEGYPAASLRAEYHNFDKQDNDRLINLYPCNTRMGNSYQYKTSKDSDSAIHNLRDSDVTKHIIIVFESLEPKTEDEKTIAQSNDYVYAQLEYILDVLSYQYCQLTGKLPTYNLIGHSRGGITNLQYALAHPNNVSSLYSMGSPYGGSLFGSTTVGGEHIFLNIAGYKKGVEYISPEGNEGIIDYNPGVLDTMDKELTDSYRNYWNDHYDKYYKHIIFRPIGTYVTFEFFVQLLIEVLDRKTDFESGWELFDELTEEAKEEIIYFCQEFLDGTEYLAGIFLISPIPIDNFGVYVKLFEKLFSFFGLDEFSAICKNVTKGVALYKHIGIIRPGSYVIKDDLFIDLDSQIADGYSGRDVVVKLMNVQDGRNADDVKCTDNFGVGHNLETQNSDIVDYVINSLNFGIQQTFSYEEVEGGYSIKNLNIEKEGTLTIPEFYNGKAIVSIDRLSRDINIGGTESYHSKVTKIIIPKTVRKISDYAFYGMNNLESINIESESALESIGTGAFMNCKSLSAFSLPESVKKIGGGAFAGCSSLTYFSIGANVNKIEPNVFFACDKLTEINVAAGNMNYSSLDGVLFDYNKTRLLEYPYGKTGDSYTVPASVTEIGEWAFYGNKTLQAINLNQVIFIRRYAFLDCTNLASITANQVRFAEEDVVSGTTWLKNSSDDLAVLGKALIKYQGNAETVNLSGVASIAPFAFSENADLKSIVADGSLINIGSNAFFECENLTDIYLNNTNQMVFVGTHSFGSCKGERRIYVPANLYAEYIGNALWKQYTDELAVHQTKLSFNSNNGSACSDISVGYYDYIGDLPVPQKEGYVFLGWYDNAGMQGDPVEKGLLWKSLNQEVTLYAKYREKSKAVYSINYHPDGGTIAADAVRTYTVDDEVTLPEITKEHYVFLGWYYDASFTRSAGSGWGMDETTGNKDLYAKWRGVAVEVTVKYGAEVLGCVTLFYGSRGQLPGFTGSVAAGYQFSGWAKEGNSQTLLTDSDGMLLEPWDQYENSVLSVVPMTEAILYSIIIVVPEGANVPEIAPTYTVESPTIELPEASLDGYEFGGWLCDEQPIIHIVHGSIGNKTIEAVFHKIYTISFDSSGGRVCGNLYGIQGDSIRLPSSSRQGCTGKWGTYNFGAMYVIPANNVRFKAVWTPNQYNLTYKIFDSTAKQTKYTYYDDDLIQQETAEGVDHRLWIPTASSSSYVFDGWYKNSNFTYKISEIAEGTTGALTVYGRWKYIREGQITVTDDGVFKQPYDSVTFQQMTGYTLAQLKAKGYKTVTFTGSLTVWQKDDGYKYVRVYDGSSQSAAEISEWWVDHRDGKTKRVYQLNDDGSWTFNLDALTSETLCFRYTASGTFSDTWYNSNLSLWVTAISK